MRGEPRKDMHDIESKLDLLSEQLNRMARQDTTAGRYYERSQPAQDNSLTDILSRVEASAINYAVSRGAARSSPGSPTSFIS